VARRFRLVARALQPFRATLSQIKSDGWISCQFPQRLWSSANYRWRKIGSDLELFHITFTPMRRLDVELGMPFSSAWFANIPCCLGYVIIQCEFSFSSFIFTFTIFIRSLFYFVEATLRFSGDMAGVKFFAVRYFVHDRYFVHSGWCSWKIGQDFLWR
jgi:hypothetical protein